MGLVDYDSGSESDKEDAIESRKRTADVILAPPTKRKKALPVLPSTYTAGVGPRDDPALHQGRHRTRPYVDGDYDAHVYISLTVPKRLYDALNVLINRTRSRCPDITLHSFLDPTLPAGEVRGTRDLHISLAHPFPLRRSQIASVKADILSRLSTLPRTSGFHVSLAGGLKMYYNGRRYGGEGSGGRAFMALRVGAGATEMNRIVEDVIHPVLKTIHRQLYHNDPEYHTSLAWCLRDAAPEDPIVGQEAAESATANHTDSADASTSQPISDDVLAAINDEFDNLILAAQPIGGWAVDSLVLKIGKDVTVLRIP